LRVLLVNDLPPGPGSGVEVHLARLLAGLRAAGDDVEVFAGEIAHTGAARALDVWDPRARRALAARAAAFRPDVVHHHHVVRELSVSVLGVPRDVPQVMTVHDFRLLGEPDTSTGVVGLAKRAKSSIDRRVARRRLDAAVAVSAPIADALRTAGFRRVGLVPVFADAVTGATTPLSATTTVAFAGRVAEDKGAATLADAWPLVRAGHPEAELVVAGHGPVAARLAALPGVTVLGLVPAEEVRALFARARAVVVPSIPTLRPEGTPTVAVEAALAGRPLVVSDDLGLRAFAQASGGAHVTPAGDAAALASAIGELLDDVALAERLGAAGRHHAEADHSTTAAIDALRAVYADVVAAR
jgi:glycosyltransferase involved in cell wall biosynthesis